MKSRGFIKTTVVIGLLLGAGVIASSVFYGGSGGVTASPDEVLTFEIVRGEFVSSITESGDIESSSNEEIRCRVRERGGTVILDIVEEGTMVKQGDFLVQLDDSSLRDELIEEKIRVASDQADMIQAESNLNTARRALEEFENGVFQQELATYQAELALAEEQLRRAREYELYSENLARKGYVTKAQLEADRFAVVKSQKELELAQNKLKVYEEYTRERMTAELKAEIKKEEANQEAAKYTLDLSQQRLKYYEKQVDACRIVAPADGQVVYANEIDRGESAIVIEEGVNVREGQPIIRLPDPEAMQVTARVNDSKINAVRSGQDAWIRLDTAPDTPIAGRVRKVASFPEPRRWSQAPIEYKVFVDVLEKNEMVRPGLRAKVEIYVERQADAVQAPVSALIEQNQSYYVVVQNNDQKLELRPVEIGPNNQSVVVIHSGLEPGEKVLVDPDNFRDRLGDALESNNDT